MSPADVEELLGAYALDALDADERAKVEHLLARSPEARRELARHYRVIEDLGTMAAASPPHEVWNRISDHIAAGDSGRAQTPPGVVDMAARRAGRPTASWFVTAVAATVAVVLGAALVVQTQRVGNLNETIAAQSRQVDDLSTELAASEVVIGSLGDTITVQTQQADELAGVLVQRDGQIAELQTQLAIDPLTVAADRAAAEPGTTLVNLAAPEVGRTQMTIVLQEDGRGFVTNSALAPLDTDRTYQLWAIMTDGRIISAAVLGNQPGVDTFVVDLDDLAALAITEEVNGGVVASENEAVLVGTIDA